MKKDRYVKIKEIAQEKWILGCPIEIEKGLLLIDNLSQNIVLQLKFRNVSFNSVKYVNIIIYRYDETGDNLLNPNIPISFSYSDLNISRNEFFGDRIPVQLGSNSARNVKIIFDKIVFTNGNIWRNEKKEEGISISQELLNKHLQPFLYEYFLDECSKYSNFPNIKLAYNFIPTVYGEFWACACGFYNKEGTDRCGRCNIEKSIIFEIYKNEYLIETFYQKTLDAFNIATTENEFLAIKTEFQNILSYKNTEELIVECTIKAQKIKMEQLAANKRQQKKKKIKRFLVIFSIVLTVYFYFVYTLFISPIIKYDSAMKLLENNNLIEARSAFLQILDYKDSKDNYYNLLNQPIATGYFHSLGLKNDGTVFATGSNRVGEINVSEWENIISVTANNNQSVGLKKDGTVIFTGAEIENINLIFEWKDIISISTGSKNVAGVKKDGTVVISGNNINNSEDVLKWKNIVSISIGDKHMVGLRKDGTVVGAGFNTHGKLTVSKWENIVAISAGPEHTVGLKKDGTVVAVGKSAEGRLDVATWKDIIAISAGSSHTVGLKKDGTVVAVGSNISGQCSVKEWKDIIAISAGHKHTIGLKKDGTVVAVGNNSDGQIFVNNWFDVGIS